MKRMRLLSTLLSALLLFGIAAQLYGRPVCTLPIPLYKAIRYGNVATSPFIVIGDLPEQLADLLDFTIFGFVSNPGGRPNFKVERESGSQNVYFYRADENGNVEYWRRAWIQFQMNSLGNVMYRIRHYDMISNTMISDTGYFYPPPVPFSYADWGQSNQEKTTHWPYGQVATRATEGIYTYPVLRPLALSLVLYPTEVICHFNGRQWPFNEWYDDNLADPYQEAQVVLFDPYNPGHVWYGVGIELETERNYTIDWMGIANENMKY